MTRRERSACDYEAYIPDALQQRNWRIDGEVAADLADAEREIVQFNARPSALTDTEGLARLLLRAEAVASSRIEGLEAGPRRILRAEAAERMGVPSLDVGADEILGNIRAMQHALESAEAGDIRPDTILRIHRELMRSTRARDEGGRFRTEQNWIGGNAYNPCGAAFVPPPPEQVEALMEDLCVFCSADALPPLAQAAIAHAQFETIHPFADGNGRTGRALIHLVLRRRGVATRFVPPVSLVLATWSDRYISGLMAYRYVGVPESAAAWQAANQWLALFASATLRALADARAYEESMAAILSTWRKRLAGVRSDAAAMRLLRALPAAPIITVTSAAELIGRSFEATNRAVERLVEAEVLFPISVGRRTRAFEARDVIEAVTGLERRLASPAGDTRQSPPSRPAPRRPGRQQP